MIKMRTEKGFDEYSMAFALAAGMVVLDDSAAVDRDCERARRRMRLARGTRRFS